MSRMLLTIALFVAFGILALVGARPLYAANQVVTNCSNDDELRADLAAMQTSGGGTLTFSCGSAIIVLDASTPLPSITTNTTISGGNTINLSGGNSTHIFFVDPAGTLTLNDIALTKGWQDRNNGGAIVSEGTLNINHSVFQDNEASLGGGGAIANYGPLNVKDSDFSLNKGLYGGAIYSVWGAAVTTITQSKFHENEVTAGSLEGTGIVAAGGAIALVGTKGNSPIMTIVASEVSKNKANSGGGIFNSYGTLEVTGGSVNGNLARRLGGGILNLSGTVTLTSLTLSGNQALDGGGIFNQDGTASLTNVTVSDNTASGEGGGIRNSGGTSTLTNVTLNGNTAIERGGGIGSRSGTDTLSNITLSNNSAMYGGGSSYLGGDAMLTNVTVSGNSATQAGGGIEINASTNIDLKNTLVAKGANGNNCELGSGDIRARFSLSDDLSCGFGVGRDDVNLLLGPLANTGGFTQTQVPQSGSPAIDNGTNAGAPMLDQRGVSRPQGAAFDIGAVEVKAEKSKPISQCSYLTQPGDNLSSIAARFGVTITQLQVWNDINNPDIIQPYVLLRVC